jgi:alpha/beta superfamily hydrolase
MMQAELPALAAPMPQAVPAAPGGRPPPAQALYFGPAGQPMFGWWHPAAAPSTLAVLLCAPWGDEEIASHRGFRQLAMALADAGLPVLRFDHAGSGDSAGPTDGADPQADLLPLWLDGLNQAADALRARSGAPRVALLGLRLGALLAAHAAAARTDVAALVAWMPLAQGRAWLRECRVLGAARGAQPGDGQFQAGGFLLNKATQASLNACAWPTARPQPAWPALVVDRPDRAGGQRCVEALRAQGVDACFETQPNLDQLTTIAHSAHTPAALIARTVAWLQERAALQPPLPATAPSAAAACGAPAGEPAASDTHAVMSSAPDTARVVQVLRGQSVREQLVRIGAGPALTGILSTTAHAPQRGLLLLSSGGERRIGPHRLWVDFARQRAALGDTVLRLDLAGIGDSDTRPGGQDNDIYDARCVDDIARALAWLRGHAGVGPCTVAGLCSGAYHAWRAALAGVDMQAMVAINPLVFHWKPGMSLDPTTQAHGQAAITQAALKSMAELHRWRKLLQGEVEVNLILRAASRHAAGLARAKARMAARALRLPLADDLSRELSQVASAGVQLHFVFSEGDPGQGLLTRQAGSMVKRLRRRGRLEISQIAQASHTFAELPARHVLHELLHRLLGPHNPG